MAGSGRNCSSFFFFLSDSLIFIFTFFSLFCLCIYFCFLYSHRVFLFSPFAPSCFPVFRFLLFQPFDFFPCVIFPFFCMTLSLSLSTSSPLPSPPSFPPEPPEKSLEIHSLHFPPVTGDQSLNLSNPWITQELTVTVWYCRRSCTSPFHAKERGHTALIYILGASESRFSIH